MKTIQKGLTNFYIEIIGWQELESSSIKDQISRKIITQLKSGGGGGSLKLI